MAPMATTAEANSETSLKPTSGRLRVSRSFNSLFNSLRLGTKRGTLESCTDYGDALDFQLKGYPERAAKHVDALDTSSPPCVDSINGQLSTATTTVETEQDLSPTSEAAEKLLLHHATAFVKAQNSVPNSLPPLPKPVVLPRLTTRITSPVVRAWPAELAQHGVAMEDFMSFIDGMNLLSNPPAAAIFLEVASIGIGFIPFDGADGVAALTELAAIGVSYRLIIVRCNNLLKKVNKEYFHARGLHARLLDTKKMRECLGVPSDDPLIAPLEEATIAMTAHGRCMEPLKAYSCELSYDVPPPSPQTEVLAKIAAWNVERKRKKFEKCSKRARKRAWKKHQAGKALKWEGRGEKARAKKLQWLLIQNLEDFERRERERAEAEEETRKEKQQKREARRSSLWRFPHLDNASPTRDGHETMTNGPILPTGDQASATDVATEARFNASQILRR